MTLSLIVAASENNVIGKKNELPWHLPDDLQYFKKMTQGKTIIMGRKTYQSIGRPLPKRRNIVLSTTKKTIDGCEVFPSLGDALLQLHAEKEQNEVFIIGGARVFKEALMEIIADFSVNKIYLTRVHANIDGDVFLPDINWKHWILVSSEEHAKDKEHAHTFTFEVYEHKTA
jgi:dihydrofolate reductase